MPATGVTPLGSVTPVEKREVRFGAGGGKGPWEPRWGPISAGPTHDGGESRVKLFTEDTGASKTPWPSHSGAGVAVKGRENGRATRRCRARRSVRSSGPAHPEEARCDKLGDRDHSRKKGTARAQWRRARRGRLDPL